MLTEEQRQRRKNGIGGSDVAAICGLNPYKSAIDVYFQKTLDDLPDQEENDNIWWGNALESVIVDKYKKIFPQKITFPDTKTDDQLSFMLANVDGILEDGGVLEVKNVGEFSKKKWGQQFTDDIPVEYYLQVAHYVRIFKAPYAHIAAYFGGADFRIFEYIPNKAIENMIVEKCSNFWENHVLKRVAPPVTQYSDQLKLWKDALADSKKEAIPDVILAIQNYKDLQSNIKELETKSEDLKSIICGFMENSEALIDNAGQTLVTWKNQKTCRFDLPKFKAEQGDLYKQLLVEKQSRVLRISTSL
jgi:putative phage-type endonuclease